MGAQEAPQEITLGVAREEWHRRTLEAAGEYAGALAKFTGIAPEVLAPVVGRWREGVEEAYREYRWATGYCLGLSGGLYTYSPEEDKCVPVAPAPASPALKVAVPGEMLERRALERMVSTIAQPYVEEMFPGARLGEGRAKDILLYGVLMPRFEELSPKFSQVLRDTAAAIAEGCRQRAPGEEERCVEGIATLAGMELGSRLRIGI